MSMCASVFVFVFVCIILPRNCISLQACEGMTADLQDHVTFLRKERIRDRGEKKKTARVGGRKATHKGGRKNNSNGGD